MRTTSGSPAKGGRPWLNRRPARCWHPVPAHSPVARLPAPLRRNALRALLLLAALPLWPDAVRAEAEAGLQQSGSLLLGMQDGYRVATRLNTGIELHVSGMVARVDVVQSFRNDGQEWVEGIYVFPLPEGAAVDWLRLRAGERVIEGEIREKAGAKNAYEAAKREGKKASLVGQQRSNLFTTEIANIAPGETVTVEIGYLDAVNYDDGAFSLRFPLTLTPRYIPGTPLADRQGSGWSPDTTQVADASLITPPVVTQSDDHRVTMHATIDAGMPLDVIASRYHPIDVDEDGGRYTVTLANDDAVSDHDLELLWRPVPSARPRALQFAETVDSQPHLLVMVMPPDGDGAATDAPPRELVFVVDTSGSMHGVSIEQAKHAVVLALGGLRPQDRFNIIQFNSVTDALFPHSVDASPGNVGMAVNYVRQLVANGGTEMRPALELALSGDAEGRLRQVVFVTDGAVGNEDALIRLIDARLGDTRLFTVGIGSAPNGWFMRKAAESGRGSFVVISALHEVQEKMAKLVRRLERPQLTDIALRWPDGVEVEQYPDAVPDLYSGEPVVVKARLSAAPRNGDRVTVHGSAAGGDWSADVPLTAAGGSAGIGTLWARARIAGLMDGLRRGAAEPGIRAAVLETALNYRLVSKYTSLVAVDRTPSRPAAAGLDREQVPNLLPYGQSHKAIFGFPATATVAPRMRLVGLVCVLTAVLLLLLRVWTLEPRRQDA